MYNGNKVIAIIPARGGSKGLPNKNILPLGGVPLLVYTIQCALESCVFDEIIVSTDSEKIAEIAIEAGAQVPYLRPANLATDTATGIDVTLDLIRDLNEKDKTFDLCMLLQPTSPLRRPDDILGALSLLTEKNAHSVISVCESEHSPLWMGEISETLSMEAFIENLPRNSARQALPAYYRLNGAIYLTRVKELVEKHDFFIEPSFAFIMPQERSVDIDTRLDFEFAEFLLWKQKTIK